MAPPVKAAREILKRRLEQALADAASRVRAGAGAEFEEITELLKHLPASDFKVLVERAAKELGTDLLVTEGLAWKLEEPYVAARFPQSPSGIAKTHGVFVAYAVPDGTFSLLEQGMPDGPVGTLAGTLRPRLPKPYSSLLTQVEEIVAVVELLEQAVGLIFDQAKRLVEQDGEARKKLLEVARVTDLD